jgi:hypothetical protein
VIRYIFFTLIISGCVFYRPGHKAATRFTYKYDGKYTGIDTLIDIKGYYSSDWTILPFNPREDNNYIFYPDGFFIYSFNTKVKDGLYGRYILCHDTIKAQLMEHNDGIYCPKSEMWFKIVNKNNISLLYMKYLDPITILDIQEYQFNKEKYLTPSKFVPFDSLPDPDTLWIKRMRFFWCDEQKYKEFKENKGIHKN